jgi:protein O-GlcNAc transferase
LPELVTSTLAEYEALALRLAESPEALAALRARLAGDRRELPLFNTPRFARHLESAFEWMLLRQRQG